MLKLTSIVTALLSLALTQRVFAAETSTAPTQAEPPCPHMKQAGSDCPHMKGTANAGECPCMKEGTKPASCPHMKAGAKPGDCPHLKAGGCPHCKGDGTGKGDGAKSCPCAGNAAGDDKPADKQTADKAGKKTPTASGRKAGKATK